MGRFTNPRDLYFGEGARHEVKNLKGRKAIIVSGGHSMRRGGFLQDVQKDLEDAGMEVQLFEGVESDPSIETVMKGAKAMQEFQPDWIVAIGGGSPIDAAKAMWVFYEYPDESFDNIIQPFSFPELRTKAKFCAISSTSGTATEVTAFSVITDYQKGIKYPLADFNITPDVAIVDPELTYSMPQKLCAHTGMDALTHCLEAYVSTYASMFTDANALHGIREIHEWLPKSYAGDHEARQHMHEAQCIAGIAFSSGLLGIVHSMAHKTGAAFSGGHIIHGCANAMYLGKVIQFNSKDARAHDRYAYVAKEILHLPGSTDDQLIDSLVKEIRHMNDQLDIPQGIKNYGQGGVKSETSIIDYDEFEAKKSEVAANALLDACTPENPRQPSQEDMEKLLECVYRDEDVDW
ncbi:iron-containing alcohol dehydrogenase [Olsenella uli]|uniref:iron-containing alcohol dehydrogenase n=1 Tax=Olsenella uli TaxID=133926 RepID=UPI0012AB6437|nr:iron-containing alcohol dehydrogenase [Olsenella uli]